MGQYDRLGEMLSDALENGFERYKKRPEKATGPKKNQDDEIPSEENTVQHFSDTKALKVLGLTEEAEEKDVKEAYRKLLKKYHPDNIPDLPFMQDTAARKTREIVDAYRKLIKK
ncbi:MAG: DnaJ domain-containing protein [Treponema sp.]|nr:DnaJ domain-containing protein [Treponema sp.]